MKRATYLVYLLIVLALVFTLGSEEDGRNDWDNTSGSGWHFSGGHK